MAESDLDPPTPEDNDGDAQPQPSESQPATWRRYLCRGLMTAGTVLVLASIWYAFMPVDRFRELSNEPPSTWDWWAAREANPDLGMQRFGLLTDIDFSDDLHGAVIGPDLFAVTRDGGQTWTEQNIDTTAIEKEFRKAYEKHEEDRRTSAAVPAPAPPAGSKTSPISPSAGKNPEAPAIDVSHVALNEKPSSEEPPQQTDETGKRSIEIEGASLCLVSNLDGFVVLDLRLAETSSIGLLIHAVVPFVLPLRDGEVSSEAAWQIDSVFDSFMDDMSYAGSSEITSPDGTVWRLTTVSGRELSWDGSTLDMAKSSKRDITNPVPTSPSFARSLPKGDSVLEVDKAESLQWAASRAGFVLKSEDQGESWTVVARPTWTFIDVDFAPVNGRFGLALNAAGEFLRTLDGGDSWQRLVLPERLSNQRINGPNVGANFVRVLDSQTAVVAGLNFLALTKDAGETWSTPPVELGKTRYRYSSGNLEFSSSKNGIVNLFGFPFLRTSDGGDHWLSIEADASLSVPPEIPPDGASDSLRTAFFGIGSATVQGAEIFVGVGNNGHIARSVDGGKTWSVITESSFGARRVSANPHLNDVSLQDSGRGFAVGIEGTVIHTTDSGETWEELWFPTSDDLHLVTFKNERSGYIRSDKQVFQTTDGGSSWRPVRIADDQTGPQPTINNIAFVNDSTGFAVGPDETFLRSDDGGQTWQKVREYSRRVPPISIACSLCGLLMIVLAPVLLRTESPEDAEATEPVKATDEQAAPPKDAIGEIYVSDMPLESWQGDRLGFHRIAKGLARYLCHAGTAPRLSIAITGEWGSGKSSMMRLLSDELTAKGRQTVNFNAWHFQDDENLLSALLESIRRQAIPPLRTAIGPNLAGWRFRWRLFQRRLARHKSLTVTLLVAWCAILAHWLTGGSDAASSSTGVGSEQLSNWLASVNLSDPWSVIETLGTTGTYGTTLISSFRALRPFGINPGHLAASDKVNASQIQQQAQFRDRFRQEFDDVAASLRPGAMVIFIDDLDRCRPDNVVTVLQTVNYLVSSGDCYVVFGMAINRVEEAVALDRAKRVGSSGDAGITLESPQEFARNYLEKLVQIEIPVPTATNEGAVSVVVTDQEQSRSSEAIRRQGTSAGEFWKPFILIATIAAILGISIGRSGSNNVIVTPAETSVVVSNNKANSANAAGSGITKDEQHGGEIVVDGSDRPGPGTETNRPDSEPNDADSSVSTASSDTPAEDAAPRSTVVSPSDAPLPSLLYWMGGLTMAAMTVALSRLGTDVGQMRNEFRRYAADITKSLAKSFPTEQQDSDDFKDSLRRWTPLLIANERRPRPLKRFVNRVRLYAMLTQENDQRSESDLPEDVIVGFSAIQTVDKSRAKADPLTYRKLSPLITAARKKASEMPDSEQMIAELDVLRRHLTKFCKALSKGEWSDQVRRVRETIRLHEDKIDA